MYICQCYFALPLGMLAINQENTEIYVTLSRGSLWAQAETDLDLNVNSFMSSPCLLVCCSCLTPQAGGKRQEGRTQSLWYVCHGDGWNSWICGGLEVASLSPGPSMTFSVMPHRKTSTVSLLMWVMSFPRGSHNDSAVHPPSAFWGSPIPPFLNPKGALSGNVPFRGASSWIFPT